MYKNPSWYPASSWVYNRYNPKLFDPPYEVNDRPLFRRLMETKTFRDAYVAEYRAALKSGGYLDHTALDRTIVRTRVGPGQSGRLEWVTGRGILFYQTIQAGNPARRIAVVP